MKIRSRLLWLVFVAWLPSALTIGIVARSAYVDQRNTSLEAVQQLADRLNLMVENELDRRFVLARTLSASNSLRANDLERFYEEAVRATQDTKSWALLFSANRQVLNTTRPYAPGFDAPISDGSPWLQAGENIYFTMSGPVVKRPVLSVISMQKSNPTPYGVAVAFDPGVLQTLVEKQQAPGNAVVTVMDQSVRVIARNRNAAKWLGKFATGPLRQRAFDGKSGFEASVNLDGVPSLTYLSKPNRYGWYAVVAVPAAALNEQAGKAAIDAVSLAALLLGVSLLIALYVARTISRPIVALKDAADALADKRVPENTSTGLVETDEVARALHNAGVHALEAAQILEAEVKQAVARTGEVQARLAEAQKREAVGRLAGGIAHDFNNLLQTINTALHLLRPTTPQGPPQRMLEAASRATGKATSLVKQMLSFGRAQTLQPEAVDINDFLLKQSELTSKAAGANVTLRAHIQPGLPAVFADPTQFELALLNVIFNARDAMGSGGNIDIRAALLSAAEAGVSESSHSQYVMLSIDDDGPGMDPITIQKAFDPYFTTKPVGSGSGLGLAQVLSFARQSGGDARLVSAIGEGTTVQILLPVTSEQPPVAVESAPAALAVGRPLRVLMVEDDPLVASVVAPAIQGAGHAVTHCTSADEAKSLLAQSQNKFDVVFSDVVMPGTISGIDLAEWCRGLAQPIPVVLATGYTAQTPQTDLTVLRKPYQLDELLKALQDAAP